VRTERGSDDEKRPYGAAPALVRLDHGNVLNRPAGYGLSAGRTTFDRKQASRRRLRSFAVTAPFMVVLGMLLANQDTELTQIHSGRKAASRNSRGR